MERVHKEACVNCHFLMKQNNPHKFELTSDKRNAIRKRDYSWLGNHNALGCYHGVWDEGYNFNVERRNEVIVTTNRKGGCFFFEYKPGMLFPAAEKLQKREMENISGKNDSSFAPERNIMSPNLLSLIENKLSLELDPKINAIGLEVSKSINSLSPNEINKLPRLIADFPSYVGVVINDLFIESTKIIFEILETTNNINEPLIIGLVNFLMEKIREETFIRKFQSITQSATRHFSRYGVNIDMNVFRYDSNEVLVKVTAKNLIHSNLNKFKNDLQIFAMKKNPNHNSARSEENIMIKRNNTWLDIEKEYDVSKRMFGKKINFIKDSFKRKVIFRDIEQAYLLANNGFSKPAVILAGSVVEELLRVYLEKNNIKVNNDSFDLYIKACETNGLLKKAVHRLSDSVRYFRNLVHLSNEVLPKHTISKATAKGAVASIFTIANDF